MASKPITPAQEQLICSLHKRMNTEVPSEIRQLDVREASMYIDRLREQLSPTAEDEGARPVAKVQARTLPYELRPTFGLAAKLVHQSWSQRGQRTLAYRDEFKAQVKETLHLLQEVEQELAAEAAGTA